MSQLLSLLSAACMAGAAIFAVREGSQLRKINRTLAKVVKDLQSGAAFAPPWQPIESAPKTGEPLIFFGRYIRDPKLGAFDIPATCTEVAQWCDFWTTPGWIVGGMPTNYWRVNWTHWMPLPEPPK